MQRLDQFNFHDRLAASNGPNLVFFTHAGCGSCRHWKALLERLAPAHPEITLFEVDAQEDLALTRAYEVTHLPALFLFKGGAYHGQVQCEASEPVLLDTLARMQQQPAEEEP